MNSNTKPFENLSILAAISPVSQGVGSVVSGWVPVQNHLALLAIIATGVLGTAATVDAKLQQATDASGTGAKDITGKAITQIVKATGDNKQVLLNAKASDLDTEGSFAFVQLSITVGAAASLVGAQLLGASPRFADASAFNATSVAQVI